MKNKTGNIKISRKDFKFILPLFIVLFSSHIVFSQEFKNIRIYHKITGNTVLEKGVWLKKDRKKHTLVWSLANEYNFTVENGNKKYITISQIHDFYNWCDDEVKRQGHEIKWSGIAAKAAAQLSKVDNFFIKIFIIRNKELVEFVHKGSENVFSFAFPKLKDVYFSTKILKNRNAIDWDENYGLIEQCEVLQPLYDDLSEKSLNQLNRMAKGKGVYFLGVPKGLKFRGELTDCEARYNHGIETIFTYYNKTKN
jgi:hypothetical protein